jgi:flagella synthesis protein FlgN
MSRQVLPDRDLARLLDEQIEAMQSVLVALETERSALGARDGDALLQAVNAKASAVADAGSLEQRRRTLLERLGIAERAARGARDFAADAGIASRWRQVVALTERCRSLNDANGQMIRGQRRRVDGALRLLRGDATVAAEYGPGGEHRSRGSSRVLGSY